LVSLPQNRAKQARETQITDLTFPDKRGLFSRVVCKDILILVINTHKTITVENNERVFLFQQRTAKRNNTVSYNSNGSNRVQMDNVSLKNGA
jgi:hypothetical protein